MSSSYITDAAWENYYRQGFMFSHGYDPLEGPYEDPADPLGGGWTEDDLDCLDEWDEEEEER